jgi:nicotinic acid phosphoribosyltransferase
MVEAEKSLSVGAYNACGVMARRAMHCLCSDKGAKGKDLYDQLLYLKDNNLITPDLWEWAEELRIVGRSGAHPEWEEVTPEDADYAVRFLREIIRYVYINPAERAEKRLKESKKKKNT